MRANIVFPELDWSGTVIRDPIYGDVRLSKWEQKLISKPICGRMRDIHQLGFVYLSYTGANHTRFEHCIGTMAAADLILHMVNLQESANPFNKWHEKPQDPWTRIEMKCFRQALRICALLHDIGHPPYSHTCENLLREDESIINTMKDELEGEVWKMLPSDTPKKKMIRQHFKEDCQSLLKILSIEAQGKKKKRKDKDIDFKKLGDHETYTKLIVHSANYGIKDILDEWAREEGEWGFTTNQRENFLKAMFWLAAGNPPRLV